jgi:hypothetical protein
MYGYGSKEKSWVSISTPLPLRHPSRDFIIIKMESWWWQKPQVVCSVFVCEGLRALMIWRKHRAGGRTLILCWDRLYYLGTYVLYVHTTYYITYVCIYVQCMSTIRRKVITRGKAPCHLSISLHQAPKNNWPFCNSVNRNWVGWPDVRCYGYFYLL